MSVEFGKVLDRLGLRISSGRTGICFENAMAESFFGTLKSEFVSKATCQTREAARQDLRTARGESLLAMRHICWFGNMMLAAVLAEPVT